MSHHPIQSPGYAPPVEEKPWGRTRKLEQTDGLLVFHASIEPGGYCSRHHHKARVNSFYVVSGQLVIEVYDYGPGVPPTHAITLTAGMTAKINPGVWHRFVAKTAVELIETYWGVVEPDDIVRADTGGRESVL